MMTQTIFELSQEAERLLQLALQNLNALRMIPMALQLEKDAAIAKNTTSANSLKFSPEGIEIQQDILQNELKKVTQHEMVLAIVGTMNAGKSTTINAIIGTEVLPNRNRPMTALPTLIRHTPGQREPILHFPHVQPIDHFMVGLRHKLQMISRENLALKLGSDKDMETLLERIIQGTGFDSRYVGAKPIFHCLKNLNDLVRLASLFEVAFPFKDYAAIEHVPFIEVEFVHLAGLGRGFGQLTLLDTPGPNEAGQPYLQEMLNQQLAQASAILVVMDYTQLKSVSDEEVRVAIQKVANDVPVTILVNKFDQKDRNSDDEEQVKALVAGTLMKGLISPDRVFPVSSMWAYLANRARHELIKTGKLPDADTHRWVADFAEAAMGRRWREEDLTDKACRLKDAELLWQDAKFALPIKRVLYKAHENASLYALGSASQKLLDYAQNMRNHLSARCKKLQITHQSLHENITHLEQELPLLQNVLQEIEQHTQNKLDDALLTNRALVQRFGESLYQKIGNYFREGFIRDDSDSSSWLPMTPTIDFPSDSERVTLEKEANAQTLLHKIRASLEMIIFTAQEALSEEIDQAMRQREISLNEDIFATLQPFDEWIYRDQFKKGLPKEISLPAIHLELVSSAGGIFTDVIRSVQVPHNRRRFRINLNKLLRNTLGKRIDRKKRENRHFVIDLIELKARADAYVGEYIDEVQHVINLQTQASLSGTMQRFSAELSQTLALISNSLHQTLAARQQNETAQNALALQLHQFIKILDYMYEDSRMLRNDLQTLSLAEK